MRKMNSVQKSFSVDEMKQLYGVTGDQELLQKFGIRSKGTISAWRKDGIPPKIELQVRQQYPAYFIRRDMDDLTVIMLDMWETLDDSQRYTLLGLGSGLKAESAHPPTSKPQPTPERATGTNGKD